MTTLRFAAFGQDDSRLAGPEIGRVYVATREGDLCCPGLVGDDQGLPIDGDHLACPPGEGFLLNVRWAMPGFGYLWLQADNGGQFYRVPRVGNAQVWNLNYELARTRVLWNSTLDAAAETPSAAASAPPQRVADAVAEAGAMLHDAMFANHDRRSRLADEALARALDGGERLAVHLARSRLRRQHAAGHVRRLRLANPVRREHLDDASAAALWQAAFDEATVTFTSEMLTSGNFAASEALVDRALALGVAVRGRSLLSCVDEHGQLRAAQSHEELACWRDQAVALARRFAGRVTTWELVPAAPHMALGEGHLAQIVDTANAVHAACPEVELVLSPGELFAPRMSPPAASGQAQLALGPIQVFRRCLAQAPCISAFGLPLYWPNCDLLQLARMIDLAASAGRPVHLLAAAAPSLWQDDPQADLCRGDAGFTRGLGFWRHPWSPEVQAEYVLGLATIARAHPAVSALEWLDFSDAAPHVFPYAGLLDAAGEAKPLHRELVAARESDFDLDRPWAGDL